MDIHQIEQVITIAALGSINKAAKELYISQPNLSLSIKNFEAELQNPIFKRSSKGVELTQFGREFLYFAQPTYQQFKNLEEFCTSITTEAPLSFSASSQYFKFASTVFVDIYNKYCEKNINFTFKEEPVLSVISSVHAQKSEIGILLLSSVQKKMLLRLMKSRGIEYHKLSEEKGTVILGSNNPLFHKDLKGVTREMIRKFPFITYSDEQYNFSIEWAEMDLINPYNRIFVSDRASMNDFLNRTNAYSIGIHNWNAYKNTEYYTNVKAYPLLDYDLSIELGWISNKSRPLSPIAKEYIDSVKAILV
jgi:DNA-binding transcriptional LysR family regulator